jgi:hypothetical protein
MRCAELGWRHDELWPINMMSCGQSTISCGQSTISCGQSTMSCGQSTISCGQSTMSCGQSTSTRVQATSYIASITDGTGVFNAGASCNRQALAYAAAGSPKKAAKLAHKPLHGRKGKPPSYGVVSRTLPACARLAQAPKPCLQHTSAHIPSCLRSGTPV